MPSPFSARSKAFLGVVLCVAVWGVNYPATKIAYKELSPLAYTGWRFLIAAALILGWAVRNGAPVLPPRGLRRYGLLLAMAGIGLYQPIFAIGVERTSGFAAALLNSVSPLLALLIVAALGYERIPRLAVAGTAVAWCGVAGFLVAAHGSVNLGGLRGNLLCLASAAFWAIYSVSSSRLSSRIPHATALATTFAIGTPILLAWCAPSMVRQDYRDVSTLTWVILVLSAIFPLYASFRLWAHALAVLGVASTTRIGVLVPVVAGISSALWTGERFSGAKLASAAVVLGGLALARMGKARAEKEG
ncbi:MAG TPA: DMT family transporter [Thermoanaerobaculia bacterium]|nr:DMT family transporter [Thermoanaerobaculia bacterium]